MDDRSLAVLEFPAVLELLAEQQQLPHDRRQLEDEALDGADLVDRVQGQRVEVLDAWRAGV